MTVRSPLDEELLRAKILAIAMVSVFCILAAVLWRVQVARGHMYEDDLRRQSVRRIRLPGLRGRIFDSRGECLADNRPEFSLAIYLEELRRPGAWSNTIARVERLTQELSDILGLPPQITRDDIRAHIRKRLPLPLLAWRGLDNAALARWAEKAPGMPGVDIYPQAVRAYPYGSAACHVLGYVGRADPPENPDETYHYYLPEMEGKAGVEKAFNDLLRGEAGGRLVRVDVSGYRHDDLGGKDPVQGHDVQVSLDVRIQQLAEKALADVRGAVVVVDPRNGDVLAMASSPGFDPNRFVPAMSTETWRELVQDPGKPLMHRAVAGAYTPGSTFKPVVVAAALEGGFANPARTFECPGYFQLGSRRFNCWHEAGHGTLNMRQSLEHSCNVYLFRLALLCGHEPIHHMAVALGLGAKTGVDLDFEQPGLVPDSAWKRRVFHEGWQDGDTCNMAIGQGALTATPLQMAILAAAIANGGTVYRPRLILGVRGPGEKDFMPRPAVVANRMNWSGQTVEIIRGGMRDVVMSDTGTGQRARVPGVALAGKTGTAEYGLKSEGRNYGWMIAFAPFEEPRYAVAMVVEDAISGGVSVAPRIAVILRGVFEDLNAGEGAG